MYVLALILSLHSQNIISKKIKLTVRKMNCGLLCDRALSLKMARSCRGNSNILV